MIKEVLNLPYFIAMQTGIYIGLGYGWTHHRWRKSPFAFKQKIEAQSIRFRSMP